MVGQSQATVPGSMGGSFEIELSSWERAKKRIELLTKLLPDQYERQKGTKLRDHIYTVPVLLAEGWVMEVRFCGQSMWVNFKPAWRLPEMKPWTRSA